ncbi:hypothetical protein Taro_020250 [Colocasia esculenta]|uniref:F-box domain-containing protein n=1 Tax=Colocasia esculenta TaxID=4460 RepID=A0A843V7Y0_COLES|nr:hypothetical protein [Colocasia esculenta]
MCSPAPEAPSPEEDAEDHFDRVPDALLLAIFNALRDVKSLGRCCAVSRRFRLLALQAESVLVRVDCVVSSSSSSSPPPAPSPAPNTPPRQHDVAAADGVGGAPKYGGILGAFARLLFATFVSRPLHALHQVLLPRRVLLAAEISHHSPAEVLRGFREVRTLQIVLPSGELGVDPGAVLRWTAVFGRSLQSCAILGATSFRRRQSCPASTGIDPDEISAAAAATSSTDANNADDDEDDQSFCTNGGLKLRVVWTITSLIAASARHFLLRDIVTDHPTLQSLEITDADGQGLLRMEKEQLEEFRCSPLEVACSSNRTQVPALNMKLWHASRLVLRSGHVMEGATLVSIMPVDRPAKVDGGDGFAVGAFDGPFREAAGALVKRKAYLLEMNPF